VDSFFGTPWSELRLENVERFLADAEDEGLTWEAKGTEQPRPQTVRKAVCAFANTDGGFLIVGASPDNEGRGWRLDPVAFNDEPATWLSNVISNLRPVPRFDVKSWEHNGGHVAVVNIDPVAEPPCMTNDAEIFTRVSGESRRVDDPATLRRLIERGEARAAQAEEEALRAARDPQTETSISLGLPGRTRNPPEPELRLRLAVAPTGRLDDVGGRLFTRSFSETMYAAAHHLPAAPLFPYSPRQVFRHRTTQDSVAVMEISTDNRQRWQLQARWDGSVAAYLDLSPSPEDNPSLLDSAIFGDAIKPAAEALCGLATALGGYGRSHVALVVYAHDFEIVSINSNKGEIPAPGVMLPIQAWTDADGRLPNEELDRMRRELCRASGAVVWEPEPDAEQES
jgi:hypothetical protein